MASGAMPLKWVSDAEWFLREASKTLSWEDLSDDIVMDIGCGFGDSSTTFLKLFPHVQKLIAIDPDKRHIAYAQSENQHEKLEYEVADIQDRSTIAQWEGKLSKAVSTFIFNTLRKIEDAFKNVLNLLQPGGEAAFLIGLKGPIDQFYETLYLYHEWKPYLKSYDQVLPFKHIRNMTDKDFQFVAMSVGFEVVECKQSERLHLFSSEDAYKNFLFRSMPIVEKMKMNRNLEEKFKNHLLELMLHFSPKTEDGKFCFRNNVLPLLLRRPQMTVKKEKLNFYY